MQYRQIMEIVKYAGILVKEGLTKVGDSVSMRTDGGMLITNPAKPLSVITAEDVVKISFDVNASGTAALHKAIYQNRSDINAVIINHAKYCVAASATEKSIPAVLDDFAQIVGPTVKTAPSPEPEEVLKTMKGRNACLIKNGGAVATGRTLDEAHTGALVLEKGAKAFIEATILGGAKRLSLFDCLLMRFIYKKKYSKADQSAKMEEGK